MAKKRTKTTASSFRRQKAHSRAQDYIERVYAEDGLIFSVTKEGQKKMFTVREAVTRVQAINLQMQEISNLLKDPTKSSSSLQDQLQRGYNFIKTVANVCKEAQKQKDSGNKKTKLLNNFVEGKDVDGRAISSSEDQRTQYLMLQLSTLDEKDIRTVLRSKEYTHEQQENILSRMHTLNMTTAMNFDLKGDSDLIL